MRIAVVGTGYVGLVAGTCFADTGHDVVCVDKDADKIERLKNGEVPIYEPGLDHLIERNVREERLSFTTDLAAGLDGARVAFIAVGTPQSHDGRANLDAVDAVAEAIGKNMTGPLVIVDKSTVPVGTAARVTAIVEKNAKHPFDVCSNPEFLKEGTAIDDFRKPDRVVIGTRSEETATIMRDLYDPFLRTGKPFLVMDPPSAEMTKYAANALLATKISFMNEVARLCEKVGADVTQVRTGVGSDSRIGHPFLFPGVGYGGSCFPKDVRAIGATAEDNGMKLEILEAVDQVNEKQKMLLVEKVIRKFGENLDGHKFALWGLAFKPETDDMREAPSIIIANALKERGATITAYDPEAAGTGKESLGDTVEIVDNRYTAIEGASALLLVTEWTEFRKPDFEKIKGSLKNPVIFDGRNIYDAKKLQELGFEYYGVGVRDSSYAD